MECWIPELVGYDSSRPWADYEEELYAIFKQDFLEGTPTFRGEPVYIRTDPRYDGREEGYWHLTCRKYREGGSFGPESRDPEPSRCERIRWPRAFIENYMRCKDHAIEGCDGVLVWKMPHKSKTSKKYMRYMLMSPEDRYIVVLEHRPNQGKYFLITAYLIVEEWRLEANLRKWEKNRVDI